MSEVGDLLDSLSLVVNCHGDPPSRSGPDGLEMLLHHASSTLGVDMAHPVWSMRAPTAPMVSETAGSPNSDLGGLDSYDPFTDGRLLRLPPLRPKPGGEGSLFHELRRLRVKARVLAASTLCQVSNDGDPKAMDSTGTHLRCRGGLAPPESDISGLFSRRRNALVTGVYDDSGYQEAKALMATLKRELEESELPPTRRPRLGLGHEDPTNEASSSSVSFAQTDGPSELPPRGEDRRR
ncbi:uncharacterized protein THITE_2123555 [Thermothielavioides terrestris NRRL 8126]|uniref:Uncharacterized protein n=1 Tax=Thermothielavioides terrestris (strain ATCC 38088 / NRRL 8126) TaxID=578455 RepID=G2RHL9_THETT|nr:uncharacterized protein THITE_2123555 [Thermothielavioides terrestris NRRL 8126]AEO71331.1 hypothetical protein THITE_2123555 [Thermothielavioides terrestris NRRL 8126]